MQRVQVRWLSRILPVCLAAAIVTTCGQSAYVDPETTTRLRVSLREAKDELRLRMAFYTANLSLAAGDSSLSLYIGDKALSMLPALRDASTCEIVDSLNADYDSNADTGIDTKDAPATAAELATRVCAIINVNLAEEVTGGWNVSTIQDPSNQDRLAGFRGTGFLYMEDDIVATAQHVIESVALASFLFIFDFAVENGNNEAATFYTDDQVRRALSVVNDNQDEDWALLRLDEAMDRNPLQPGDVDMAGGEEVFAIGHPFGLPRKYAGIDEVTCSDMACVHFKTSLRMYWGNSGSPVFENGVSEPLVGIHTGHIGTPIIDYLTSVECFLFESLFYGCIQVGAGDCLACCYHCCGSSETRIGVVDPDAGPPDVDFVTIENNSNTNAFMYLGPHVEQTVELERGARRRIPINQPVSVWLLSCGEWGGFPRCRWRQYDLGPGEQWRIEDEEGTRIIMVMERD